MSLFKPSKPASGPVETPAASELTETDLENVNGGFAGFLINPPPKTGSGGGGTLKIDGVAGESVDAKHRD